MTSDIETDLSRLRDHAEQLNLLADRLQGIRAEESSPDGTVTVLVDGTGAPVDIRLSPAIARLSPREFGRILVTTAERAAWRAFAECGDLITAFTTGEDPTSTEAVADRSTLEWRA